MKGETPPFYTLKGKSKSFRKKFSLSFIYVDEYLCLYVFITVWFVRFYIFLSLPLLDNQFTLSFFFFLNNRSNCAVYLNNNFYHSNLLTYKINFKGTLIKINGVCAATYKTHIYIVLTYLYKTRVIYVSCIFSIRLND